MGLLYLNNGMQIFIDDEDGLYILENKKMLRMFSLDFKHFCYPLYKSEN